MIKFLKEYEQYIKEQGVGSKDVVADSRKSYVSSLRHVSKHLEGIEISPETLSSEDDINDLSERLSKTKKVSEKTIKNYCSAMKQYVRMIKDLKL